LKVLLSVSVSAAVACLSWKLITIKGKAKSPADYGLKWLAIGTFAIIFGNLPRVLLSPTADNILLLMIGLGLGMPLFALIGLTIGKLSSLKVKNTPNVINEKTSKLVSKVKGITDEIQGAKLLKNLSDNLERLSKMDSVVFDQAISTFVSKRDSLSLAMVNMSSKGCIQTGQKLQIESKQFADLDVSHSCALWLTGAWLESLHRTSDKAKYVHALLSDITEDDFPSFDDIDEGSVLMPHMPDITKCVPIKQAEVGEFTVILMKDVPAINDTLKMIEYFFVMALISNHTNLPVYFVTSEAFFGNSPPFLCSFSLDSAHFNHGNELDYKDINVFSKEASKIMKLEMPDSYAFSS